MGVGLCSSPDLAWSDEASMCNKNSLFGWLLHISIGLEVLGHFDDVQQKAFLGASVRRDLFPAILTFREGAYGATDGRPNYMRQSKQTASWLSG
jgi:hypothetical protein